MLSDWTSDPILMATIAGALLVLTLCFSLGLVYLTYHLLTLPLRRAERARLFLDLVERGLADGQTPELTVAQIANTRDRMLDGRWQKVAAHLQSGLTLANALEKTPSLIGPQLTAMFRIGERTAKLATVLPAGRALLGDALSQTRGAINYIILITLSMSPAIVIIPWVFRGRILPSFETLFYLREDGQIPAFTRLVFDNLNTLLLLQTMSLALLWLGMVFYAGGPRIQAWFKCWSPGLIDALLLGIPWRRNRLRRDFSFLLSVLLDAGIPEDESVRLAGEATANSRFLALTDRVLARLASGSPLPQALQELDDSGQLRWRLSNAAYAGAGFQKALSAWHEHLDAKAFQQEQAAAQVLSTGLLLYNGVLVAGISAAVFLGLIGLIEVAALW